MGNNEMYHVPSDSGSKLSSWLELFKENSSMKEESRDIENIRRKGKESSSSESSMGNKEMYHVPSGSGSKLSSWLELFKENSKIDIENIRRKSKESSSSESSMGNKDMYHVPSGSGSKLSSWLEFFKESSSMKEESGKESSSSESSMGNKEMYHVPSGSGSKLSSWLELFKENSSMKEESIISLPQSSYFVENSSTSMGNNKDWK
ncbi:hypothetical protein FRX31_004575 [Thalictrum thalictroides]|uniref:Uncharacterized protein n=1 Tax=Thalictrum thalictroides TaxID=46969 RepID=A0A7J6XAI4_THATH|nr:hypothetical protein FRX31_004575 [Thalictrum thalictroides]